MTTPTTSRVSDAQREAFEKWMHEHFKYPDLTIDTHHPEHYAPRTTAYAWQAWQAALASLGDVVAVSELRDLIATADEACGFNYSLKVVPVDDLSAILNRGGK